MADYQNSLTRMGLYEDEPGDIPFQHKAAGAGCSDAASHVGAGKSNMSVAQTTQHRTGGSALLNLCPHSLLHFSSEVRLDIGVCGFYYSWCEMALKQQKQM